MAGLPTVAERTLRRRLEEAKRLTALQVDTLAHAVGSLDDEVGWARLTELGTASTVRGQETAASATLDALNATLEAAGTVGDITDLGDLVRPGRLASGKPVRGMFAATRDIVARRMTAPDTPFPVALDASANALVGFAASEPHRINRDGQLGVGLSDGRFNRYRRVAVGTTCSFCLMLATRGAVYLTAASAGQGRRYHHMCDCYVELVVDQDAIARSQSLQGDWRNAIKDPQRMREAGALRGMGGMSDDFVRQQITREAAEELAAREAFDAANPTGTTAEAADLLTTGGWSPGKWVDVTPDEALFGGLPEHIAATLREKRDLAAKFDAMRAKPKPTRPVAHAMVNGNKTIISEQPLSKPQLAGLLADLDEAIAAMPDDLRGRGVSLMVPVGDPKFKSGAGGYVIGGSPRIYVKPAIAKGAETWDNPAMGSPVDGIQYGHHMPAAVKSRTRRDVIMHEMGHVVDDMKQHTGVTSSWEKQPKWSEEAFWTQNVDRLPARMYAQKNAAEGYAEAFMQYHVGGPGSTPMSDAYAARYRW